MKLVVADNVKVKDTANNDFIVQFKKHWLASLLNNEEKEMIMIKGKIWIILFRKNFKGIFDIKINAATAVL